MANETVESKAATSGGQLPLVVLILVGILAMTAGVATPWVVQYLSGQTSVDASTGEQIAVIPFTELNVNLNEPVPRFLMVNILVVVDESKRREVSRQLERQNYILRDWLISHLSDKSYADVQRREGQNALRREILTFFNEQISGGGPDLIREIIFDKFNMQ